MKRLSIVLIGLLCVLVGCGNQNKSASTELETTPSGMVDASQKATDALTERISELTEIVHSDEGSNDVDGMTRTKEKGVSYLIFNCNDTYFGSADDENYWWELKVENTKGLENLEDGGFAYCNLNIRKESGGIAGVNNIIVEKVNSCGRCTLDDVKARKGELLMQYELEHPFVAGISVYKDFVIANETQAGYSVYQNGAFVNTFEDIEDVTKLLKGDVSTE